MDFTPLIFAGIGVGLLLLALWLSTKVSHDEWEDKPPNITDFLG